MSQQGATTIFEGRAQHLTGSSHGAIAADVFLRTRSQYDRLQQIIKKEQRYVWTSLWKKLAFAF